MNKQSANDVIKSTKRTLGFAVLRGGIRTGETQENSILWKEILISKVVKFTTIITLYESYREEKVDRDIVLKGKEYIMNVGFVSSKKSPNIMSKIIKNHKITLKTRYTFYW